MKFKWFFLRALVVIALNLATSAFSQENFDATTEAVGYSAAGMETPVNQLVTPDGIQVPLPGVRPNALALSPDGKLLVTSGLMNELLTIDPVTGKILQHVSFPSEVSATFSEAVVSVILNASEKPKLSFTGLVFSPDGSRIYLSNVNGDLKVFGVGQDGKVSPLSSIPLPPANMPDRKAEIPTGIAVSADNKKIYVAFNVANKVAELDATNGKLLRSWGTGVAPYGVALCGNKLYVSNWGGRRPDANSLVGPIGNNGTVRVDARSVASEGSVSVIDLTGADPPTEILTGRHASALALSPNQKYLAVANAGDDTISVIDTRTDKIAETLCTRQSPADLFGAQPDALTFDKRGKRLFVCNGTQNAVAVFKFKPGESEMLGLIPVGWFPGSIAFDSRHKMLEVANIKDIATIKQKATRGRGNGTGFNSKEYTGSLSLVPLPSSRELSKLNQTALADLRYPLLAQAKLPPRGDRGG